MNQSPRTKAGIQRLVEHYRSRFEVEENLNYYSYKDYLRAQRKYIKFVLGNVLYPSDKRL